MIAVDTNILVYAQREDSPWHDSAYASVVELAEGRTLWAIYYRLVISDPVFVIKTFQKP